MTASALKSYSFDVDTDEQNQSVVRRLAFQELAEPSAGTRVFSRAAVATAVTPRPVSTPFAFFSDGSSLRAPSPIGLRAWKAIPTSAGKTFEWEGLVLEIQDASFSARLRNIKGAKAEYDEIAQFDLADVPPGDRDLLHPGAIFRWVVGLESRSGTRQRYSRIVFRRLPAWTSRSLKKSEEELKALVSGIQWIKNDATSTG
jgi:hypothetical protein